MSLYMRIGGALTFALAAIFSLPAYAGAAGVHVYPLAATGYMPDSVVQAADGSIWFSAAELSPCHGNVTCQTEEMGKLDPPHVRERALGRTTVSGTYGITPGPARTLWLTDDDSAAYVFNLAGKKIETLNLSTQNGDGALSAPFIGPDGRMWFALGSFGQGATGVVAVDQAYNIALVAGCSSCFFSGGVVAADGNAWFLDPYLGGFYRVTPQGALTRFDYGKFVLDTIVPGRHGGLWGVQNTNIAEYDFAGRKRASFTPKIAVQSGLHAIGSDFVWANFGPSKSGSNELRIVKMNAAGMTTESRYQNLGPCTSGARQWFSSGPTLGADGALYVGIGCSPNYAPYTVGGHAAIVRIQT